MLFDVTFANDVFVAVGTSHATSAPEDRPLIATSADGVAWTVQETGLPLDVNRRLYVVTYGNGRFVAMGRDVVQGTPSLTTSTDGVIWTAGSGPTTAIYDVTYGADRDRFVAVGEGVWVSVDGLSWAQTSPPRPQLERRRVRRAAIRGCGAERRHPIVGGWDRLGSAPSPTARALGR